MRAAAALIIALPACLALSLPPAVQARETGWAPIETYDVGKDLTLRKKGGEAAKSPAAATAPGRKRADKKAATKNAAPPARPDVAGATVYENQPPVSEQELAAFVDILPSFRAWARESHEEAHPVMSGGQPDFLYSPSAGAWVEARGWRPKRFFCVMGRMAAAMLEAEEGNDLARAPDMPKVSASELALARKHLGSLLRISGSAAPIRH